MTKLQILLCIIFVPIIAMFLLAFLLEHCYISRRRTAIGNERGWKKELKKVGMLGQNSLNPRVSESLKTVFTLNTGGLQKQYWLWFSIITPLLYAGIAGALIWRPYHIAFSSQAVINLFRISKAPFLILGTSIPFGALIARIHATVQAEKRMKMAESQNNFINYIRHRESFFDFLNKTREDLKIEIHGGSALYKISFPDNTPHSPISVSIPPSLATELSERHNTLLKIAYDLNLYSRGKRDYTILNDIDQVLEIYRRVFARTSKHARHIKAIINDGKFMENGPGYDCKKQAEWTSDEAQNLATFLLRLINFGHSSLVLNIKAQSAG